MRRSDGRREVAPGTSTRAPAGITVYSGHSPETRFHGPYPTKWYFGPTSAWATIYPQPICIWFVMLALHTGTRSDPWFPLQFIAPHGASGERGAEAVDRNCQNRGDGEQGGPGVPR
jgi:hypothetical protein